MAAIAPSPAPTAETYSPERVAVVVGEDGRAPDRSWLQPLADRGAEVVILRPVEPDRAGVPLTPLGFGDAIGMYALLRAATEEHDALTAINLERLSDALADRGIRHHVVHVPSRPSSPRRRGRRRAALAVLSAARDAGATTIVLADNPGFADELVALIADDPSMRLSGEADADSPPPSRLR